MKIIQKFGQGKLIPRNKVDNTILEHMKRQGIVLPPSKNEQVSADNRTKELRDYQNTQQQINQNLEKGKYLNFWTQPYSGFSGRQATELGNNLFKQSIYAGAGEVAGTYALQGLSKLSKFIPKLKMVKPIETKVGPKTYEELKDPVMGSVKDIQAVAEYKKSSKFFKNNYNNVEEFYKDYFGDITSEELLKLSPHDKDIADNIYNTYKRHKVFLEGITKRTKGDKLKLIRHTDEILPVGEYEPKRPLSFSFPEGSSEFGRNRLIVEIPEEQSYLASEKLLQKFPKIVGREVLDMHENEVLLPRKLKFKITKAKKPNEFGGDDYIGKILNPYLMPLITIPYDRKNN